MKYQISMMFQLDDTVPSAECEGNKNISRCIEIKSDGQKIKITLLDREDSFPCNIRKFAYTFPHESIDIDFDKSQRTEKQ